MYYHSLNNILPTYQHKPMLLMIMTYLFNFIDILVLNIYTLYLTPFYLNISVRKTSKKLFINYTHTSITLN